jgi:uncharacterized protein
VNPFYFGTGQRRLFGLYTPSRAAGGAPRGVVLCHPWGNEYLAAHRSMRQLASMLSSAGFHVLSFDYFGTGDSAGDLRDADLRGWQDDIAMAIEELKDTSGAPRVSLAGLRLGATLAAAASVGHARDVEALVLWDPIAAGAEYVRELMAAATVVRERGEHEVGGFPLTPRMADELRAIDLPTLAPSLSARTLAIVSADGASLATLRAALEGRHRGALDVEHIESAPAWVEDVSFGTGAIPARVLRRIAEWMA